MEFRNLNSNRTTANGCRGCRGAVVIQRLDGWYRVGGANSYDDGQRSPIGTMSNKKASNWRERQARRKTKK